MENKILTTQVRIRKLSLILQFYFTIRYSFLIKKTNLLNDVFYMKQRILVTGGTGYIGSHTVVELQNSGYDVVIIDNLSNSREDVVDSIEKITNIRPAFEKVDCLDFQALENVFKKYDGIKGIIHFAASKAVGESVKKPLLYYRNNLVSLINLLELMPKYSVDGIIFSSSCTVYGQPDILPVTEEAPIKKAESPYGNTKQINEEIIRDTIASGSPINSIILRYFNPIGAHPTALLGELPNGVPQNLVPFLTQTAMGIREQLSVFGNDYNTPDGSCIRDYINVVDLAKAHVVAMDRLLNNKQLERVEVFNIGTGNGLSVLDLINAFESSTGVKLNYKIAGRREGDIEKVWANPERANNVLGWKAEVSIEETVKSAWNWQLKLREKGIQ
jgi:UDP-glucose 4-epimerase